MANKANLLLKLSAKEDLCTVEKVKPERGRISNYFFIVREKFNELFKAQLVFLIFVLPALALLVYGAYLSNLVIGNLNIASNMGIGYFSISHTINDGIIARYETYQKILLYVLPAIVFAGIGASGLFYVSRGFMWNEPVIIRKAYFRGILKHWWKFLIVFVFIAGIIYGMGTAVLHNMIAMVKGTATPLNHILMYGSCIVGFIMVMVLILLLPMFCCYDFKFFESLKNTLLLIFIDPILVVFMTIVTVGPLLLLQITAISQFVMMIYVGFGFVFLSTMWTSFAQNEFNTFIGGMFRAKSDSKKKKDKKKKKNTEFVNPKKKKK